MLKFNYKISLIILLLLFAGCNNIAVTPDEITNKDTNLKCAEDGDYYIFTNTQTLAAGNTYYYLLNTSDYAVRMTQHTLKSENNDFLYNVFSNPSLSNNGALGNLNNYNFNNNLSTNISIHLGGTVTNNGSLFFQDVIYSNFFTSGSCGASPCFTILDNNSNYLFLIKNDNGLSSDFRFMLSLCEVR